MGLELTIAFAGLREEVERIDPAECVAAHFEVQVGARAVAGTAHPSDDVALRDSLTASDVDLAQVRIKTLPAIPVIENDGVAIAPVIPTGVNHDPIVGSINSAARATTNVDRLVDPRYIGITGDGRARSRPTEGAVSCRAI